MAPEANASATAADLAPTRGGWASLSGIPATSISLLCATEPGHQRTVAARQIRFDPHVVVLELPCPLQGDTTLLRRQLDDDGSGPPEPSPGLLQDGFHVSQPGSSVATGRGDQRPPGLRFDLRVQPFPLPCRHVRWV